ncbi:MAG: enoyl-CoA hydratase/isomerase family protein [Bradyrhizobium sp.]
MSTYEFIRIDRHDSVAVLTLNRPDNLNSWNSKMRGEMRTAVDELAADDNLRVLVITGSGRGFSAGEDVRGMEDLAAISTRGFRRVVRTFHNIFDELESMEVPVIAAINGIAAGGGLELALSCDFRIASDAARMGFPENKVGLIPGSGGCSRLVKLVGPARAKRLVMTGKIVTADEALALCLVEEVVPAAELMTRAMEFARELAAKAPQATGLAKLVINNCLDVDLNTGRNFERLGQSVLKRTQDHKEGALAFVEKRSAKFTGR